jgi:hypothetical protein
MIQTNTSYNLRNYHLILFLKCQVFFKICGDIQFHWGKKIEVIGNLPLLEKQSKVARKGLLRSP